MGLPGRVAALLALALSCGVAGAEATSSYYLCKAGAAPQRLDKAPPSLGPERLAGLAQWDAFAVKSVAAAVTGKAALKDALPLFQTLLRSGPFAGAYADAGEVTDPFVLQRGQRFLDAAARLAAGPPLDLVRELLADAELVGKLRAGSLAETRAGGEMVYTKYLYSGGDMTGWGRFLPVFLGDRDSLADKELLARCRQGIDGGKLGPEGGEYLGRTLLWDLRLYLVAKPRAEDVAAALRLPDGPLGADYMRNVSVAHLRHLILGARAGDEKQWAAFEAERFISERPDWAWVAHAAALLHEVECGTVLQVTGEAAPGLAAGGETQPLTYSVQPGCGATYATAALVWPGSPTAGYEGVRCLEDTRLVRGPQPMSAAEGLCGLRYSLAFKKAGPGRMSFQYKLYGLDLPTVNHVVEVATSSATPRVPVAPLAWSPVTLELTSPPGGYAPVSSGSAPGIPGQRPSINGGRRFLEFADGVHGMDQLILYEVRTGPAKALPEDFAYCDLNPRGDPTVSERTLADAEAAFPKGRELGFALAPRRARLPGRDCWVGRKGLGPDGKGYFVLCRGTQTYCQRSAVFPLQRYWEPLLGEQGIYEPERMRADTEAYAQAVLGLLQALGPGASTAGAAARAPAEQALTFLKSAREVLKQEADLRSRIPVTVGAWRQKTMDKDAAAKALADEVVVGYDSLTAKAAALHAPDATLAGLLEGLRTSLGMGAAAARLAEKGVRMEDEGKVARSLGLLSSDEAFRAELQARSLTLDIEYRGTDSK